MTPSDSDRAFLASLRGDGEAPLEGDNSAIGRKMRSNKGALKALSIPGFSFRAPSLIDRSKPYFSGIRRFGVSKVGSFYKDPFHTLLNLPWGSFIFVFFSTYILQYIAFAFLYWMQGSCVKVEAAEGAGSAAHDNTFARSLWMSSRVASTLGFTEIRPDPECPFVNFCVMIQVIASSLVNFIMLGVVFARFSAPFKRASTVRFSKVATVSRHPSGFWALSLRVANLRKHQILQPTVRLVVTAVDSITPSFYHHEQLQIEGAYKQLTNLELGFPATISHVVTPDSFLYNLSLLEMDTRMMEILVFVDGIDAMTSKYMSARIAYSTSDIYMNEMFAPMNLEMRGKYLGLDFSDFDKTIPALDSALLVDMSDEPKPPGAPAVGGGGLWQLRHQTFKRLAERYAHLGVSHTAVVAAAAAAGTKVVVPDVPSEIALTGGPSGSSDMQGSLLAGHVLPSHLPAAASMTSSTSGMPFAVSRPSAQAEQPALSALFGGNKNNTGSAWTSIHSKDHRVNGEGAHEAEPFVPVPSLQRGPGGAGSAWAQSGIPLSPMPVLGAPPVGLGGQHPLGNSNTSPSFAAGGGGPAGGQFSSPLLQQDMYTLDEENPPLPASKNGQ